MKVTVNHDLCVGSGACESICPQIFEIGDAGLAVARLDEVPPELEDDVREAAGSCPVEAIVIED